MGNNTENTGTMTTVKTVYARAAVLLLALNFCLTGYVVLSLNKTVQEQVDGATSAANSIAIPATLGAKTATTTTPGTREATTENPQ